MNQPSTLAEEATAIHESAHAVAFVILGLAKFVDAISVVADGLTLGSLKTHPGLRFPVGTQDPNDLATIEKVCMGFMVAKNAEMKYLRQQHPTADPQIFETLRWQTGVTDIEQAVETAAQRFTGNTVGEIRAFLGYIWVRAKAFVDDEEHWYVIQSIAGKLIALRKIDGALVSRLIEGAQKEYFGGRARVKPAPVSKMEEVQYQELANGLLPDLLA